MWYARGYKDMGKILGIDYGAKRIGVALSNEEKTIAFPEQVIPNTPRAIPRIADLIDEQGVSEVIMGESVDFSGTPNPIMRSGIAFAQALEEQTGITVVFERETYTSAQAHRQFELKEKTRKPLKRERVDASAAALILQSYLDKQR